MLGKRAIGQDELIRKYRRYICQAAASVAGGGEKPLIRPANRQTPLGPDESRPGPRLEAHLTQS